MQQITNLLNVMAKVLQKGNTSSDLLTTPSTVNSISNSTALALEK